MISVIPSPLMSLSGDVSGAGGTLPRTRTTEATGSIVQGHLEGPGIVIPAARPVKGDQAGAAVTVHISENHPAPRFVVVAERDVLSPVERPPSCCL